MTENNKKQSQSKQSSANRFTKIANAIKQSFSSIFTIINPIRILPNKSLREIFTLTTTNNIKTQNQIHKVQEQCGLQLKASKKQQKNDKVERKRDQEIIKSVKPQNKPNKNYLLNKQEQNYFDVKKRKFNQKQLQKIESTKKIKQQKQIQSYKSRFIQSKHKLQVKPQKIKKYAPHFKYPNFSQILDSISDQALQKNPSSDDEKEQDNDIIFNNDMKKKLQNRKAQFNHDQSTMQKKKKMNITAKNTQYNSDEVQEKLKKIFMPEELNDILRKNLQNLQEKQKINNKSSFINIGNDKQQSNYSINRNYNNFFPKKNLFQNNQPILQKEKLQSNKIIQINPVQNQNKQFFKQTIPKIIENNLPTKNIEKVQQTRVQQPKLQTPVKVSNKQFEQTPIKNPFKSSNKATPLSLIDIIGSNPGNNNLEKPQPYPNLFPITNIPIVRNGSQIDNIGQSGDMCDQSNQPESVNNGLNIPFYHTQSPSSAISFNNNINYNIPQPSFSFGNPQTSLPSFMVNSSINPPISLSGRPQQQISNLFIQPAQTSQSLFGQPTTNTDNRKLPRKNNRRQQRINF